MGYTHIANVYRETGVRTASQGQLIVMLYDEAVKQLNMVIALFESDIKVNPHYIEKANNAVLKTQEIIAELMSSLDMNSGGDIAKNLFSLYVYFNQELLDANINKDAQKISSVRDMLDDLRTTWVQIVNTTPAVKTQHSVAGSINITG